MNTLHFLRPDYMLALLLVLPAVAALLWASAHQRLKARRDWAEENKLTDRFSRPFSKSLEVLKGALWLTAVAAVVVAAAGPVMEDAPLKVREGSMELVSVVDVSTSMAAEDYRTAMPDKPIYDESGKKVIGHLPQDQVPGAYGSRLDMTKHVIKTQIMPTLERNKLGLVNYSGEGFIQADLTDDYAALTWVMDHWMRIGQAPGGGSDYAIGLETAYKMFKEEPPTAKQRIILLFTDGGFTGDPAKLQEVLGKIREAGIRIIVVGLGSSTPVTIPLYSSEGQLTGYVQKDNEVVTTAIDEAACQTLVSLTGGEYIRLDPENPRLSVKWTAALGGTKYEKHEDQVFQYPLGAALAIMLGLLFVGILRRERTV
jgi:hypothetical protein